MTWKQRIRKLSRHMKWSLFRRLGRRDIFIQTRFGYKMRLEFLDGAGLPIYVDDYEQEETNLIFDLVQPGMITLDIGANLGYFTLLMACKVGAHGQVHAFEPHPVMFKRLEGNIAINPEFDDGRIIVHKLALGSESGEAEFFCPVHGHEGEGGLRDTKRAPIESVIRVPLGTLDEFIVKHAIEQVDFIKMDIEGGELDVLRGGARMLEILRPTILFEAYEANTAPYGYRVFEILSFLEQRGYIVKQAGMSFNFLAMPGEHA